LVGLTRVRFLLLVCCAANVFAQSDILGPHIRAGAARVTLTPDLKKHGPVYMAGFGNNRVATGIHDQLYARCLALSAAGKTIVLCGVDSIGVFLDDVERIRAEVKRQLAAGKKAFSGDVNVVVASTHDHEAPDTMGLWGPERGRSGMNDAYMNLVVERVAQSAVTAVRALQPALIKVGEAHRSDLDAFIHDDRPPEVLDAGVIVLHVTTARNKPIATLVNWANHPETLGSENTLITADYSYYLCNEIEQKFQGVAVFLNGAVGGMQSPLGANVIDTASKTAAPENTFQKAEIIGRGVAESAGYAVRNAKQFNADQVDFRERLIQIPVANHGFQLAAQADLYKGRKKMTADGATTTPVGLVRLLARGKVFLEIALIPGEMYPELSVGGVVRYSGADFPDAPVETPIKSLLTAEFKMLAGLADDEIGYIIPKAEWDEKPPYLNGAAKAWYGEENSVGPEAASRIAAAFAELVKSAGVP